MNVSFLARLQGALRMAPTLSFSKLPASSSGRSKVAVSLTIMGNPATKLATFGFRRKFCHVVSAEQTAGFIAAMIRNHMA
jgi:hypothetical protein